MDAVMPQVTQCGSRCSGQQKTGQSPPGTPPCRQRSMPWQPAPAGHCSRALWASHRPAFKQNKLCRLSIPAFRDNGLRQLSIPVFEQSKLCRLSISAHLCLEVLDEQASPSIQPQTPSVPHTSIANQPRLDSTAALSNKTEARLRPPSCLRHTLHRAHLCLQLLNQRVARVDLQRPLAAHEPGRQ